MLNPGELTRSVRFDQQSLDADGNPTTWAAVVTRSAKILPLKGSEPVQEQRLQGHQPVVIIVRRDTTTKAIDNSYRAVDARDTTIQWDITSAIWNEGDGTMELLAVQRRGD